jgi:hypothetical protein
MCCSANGCEKPVYAKGYCRRHYEQVRTLGAVKRTKLDGNEYRIYKDYAEIVLFNNKGQEVGATKISLHNVDKAKTYKWRLDSSTGYVLTTLVEGHKTLSLHRYLMDAGEGDIVDHREHDILDNRDDNLRLCTVQENNQNKRRMRNNTSGVAGVSWHSRDEVWTALIGVDGKLIHLGTTKDKKEAIKWRQEAEIIYFGEFRCIDK